MAKKTNVTYQMVSSINEAFSPGSSKHGADESYKENHVFSYQYRSNLIKTANQFGKWLKANHPEIRKIKDVKSEHVSEYLKEKSKTCSAPSISRFKSEIEKIGKCCASNFGVKVDLSCKYHAEPKEKIRDVAVSEKDYKAFMDKTANSKADSRIAIQLSHAFGLRVSETVRIQPRDIDMKKNTLFIHQSKGGRDRTLAIDSAEKKNACICVLERAWERNCKPNENILAIKESAVARYFSRNMASINKEYTAKKTGVHAVRKNFAIRTYESYGGSKNNFNESAWDKTAEILGHGEGRMDLFEAYCPGYASK